MVESHPKISSGQFYWHFLFSYDLILSIGAKLRCLRNFKYFIKNYQKVFFSKFYISTIRNSKKKGWKLLLDGFCTNQPYGWG